MSFVVSDEIQNIQNELNTINQRITQTDFFLFFNRTNKYFMTTYKMPTSQKGQDYLVFTGVKEYSLPTDFVGMLNLERPYELGQQNFYHGSEANFIRWMQENWSAVKFDSENKLLLLNYNEGDKLMIHNLDSLTEDGTWTVSGDGSSLAVDEQYYTEGEGSLRFSATYSAGTATVVNSTMTAFDLTDYIDNGYLFLDVFNSSTTNITSIQVRIGSDASNYYQVSATTRYNGVGMGQSFGQIGFDLSGKTTVGSPTVTALDYVQFVFTLPSGFSGTLRIDNFFVALPTYFRLPYYSLYNIKDTTGTYKEAVTATSDTVLCPSEFNEAFTYKICAMGALLKLGDATEANYFENKASEKEADLRAKYLNQDKRNSTTYYRNWNKW